MIQTKKHTYVLAIIVLFFVFSIEKAHSVDREKIIIAGINEPPANFTNENGQLQGLSIDIVKEILKRMGSSDQIHLYPWARARKHVLDKPNFVTFSVSRTAERENKFHWITPVVDNIWSFYSLKKDRIQLISVEDAKNQGLIAVQRGGAREAQLKRMGFTNLDPSTTHKQSIKKMMAGRIALVYADVGSFTVECAKMGIDMNIFNKFETGTHSNSYIIMSKVGTSPTLVKKWKKTAEEIKKDGTFDAFCAKWRKFYKEKYNLETNCVPGVQLNMY